MSAMKKTASAPHHGKVHAREGGYKPHGNKSSKTVKRTTQHMPAFTASSSKGRQEAGSKTTKNAA